MKKRFGICAITLVIAGLMITTAASVPPDMNTEISKKSPIWKTYTAQNTIAQDHRAEIIKTETNQRPLTLDGSIQITGGDFDEYHPSICTNPVGGFYAFMEAYADGNDLYPTMLSSADGLTWEASGYIPYMDSEYTDCDANSIDAYGSFGAPPDNTGFIVVVEFGAGQYRTWNYGDNDFSYLEKNRMSAYEDPLEDGEWEWGCITLIGDYPDGRTRAPMIFYQEKGNNLYGLLSTSSGIEFYDHPDGCIDPETLHHFAVYDHDDGDHIFVRITDFSTWQYNSGQDYYYHPSLGGANIPETEFNLSYPAVGANNDKIIICAQKDDGRSTEIICYYSDDGLTTYGSTIIGTGEYPEIVMMDEDKAVCTFMDGGVLYESQTDSGGASWSTPVLVHDNQIQAEYRAAGVGLIAKPYVIWQDNRGANLDIYYGTAGTFVEPAILEVTLQTGLGIGAKAIVKNVGETDATDVTWTITAKGGILGLINKTNSNIIGTLPKEGGEQTISTGLIIGFGKLIEITAEASADGAISGSDLETGFQLIIFTKVS